MQMLRQYKSSAVITISIAVWVFIKKVKICAVK